MSAAIAPSPTADATRFIESSRTSPAAKTPGRLVSSANGSGAVSGDYIVGTGATNVGNLAKNADLSRFIL